VFTTINLSAQKVGLVLSGGGSSGITHVGVIKALEEYGIPIDYITGTSMGALVGALYATGYSPEEIEAFFLSEEFQHWTTGSVDNYSFYLKKKEEDASLLTIKLSTDTLWEFNLPTNLVSSSTINYGLLTFFSPATTYAKEDFNNLFIPFRCVASDIISKKEVVFSKGKLTTAVRASMAYPFYLKPVTYNDMLLFDGGLYNNFPANVMEDDFNPDFIIGSNVSFNFEKPYEDNIVSQIKTIVTNETKYVIPSGKGIMIEPNVADNATFNFDNNEKLIKIGYDATIARIGEIQQVIKKSKPKSEVKKKRELYKSSLPEFLIDKVEVKGLNQNQNKYIKNSLWLKKGVITPQKLKPEYIKLLSDDKIKSINPEAQINDSSGYYTLKLNAKKEKDLFVSVGGLFSSRPISEGFIGVKYNLLDKAALTLLANTYFGRFHNSIQAGFRIDIPFVVPFYWKNTFNMGDWDYYKSNNIFFEDKKPSFLVNNDIYAKTEIGLPVFYKGKLVFEGSVGEFMNEYYQTKDFLSTDTTDQTHFKNVIGGIKYERNSLDRKQYPSIGSFFTVKYKYVKGKEETVFGSTSTVKETLKKDLEWGQVKLTYEQYFNTKHNVRFGIFGEGVYSNQPFFSNYTASVLAAPDFQPFAENKTVFNENLRAHSYLAVGLKNIYYIFNKFQLRLEAYTFQPYQNIFSDVNQQAFYSKEWTDIQYMASTSVVYYTPVGPIAFNVNYYDRATDNWSFLFHFGYVIFNKKSLD
jgi:NTE family protein